MSERKHKVGEVLSVDTSESLGELYVYGWLPQDAALAALMTEGHFVPDRPTIRYRWGRFAQDGNAKANDWTFALYCYDEPGPGRFKLMEIM